MRLAIEKLEQEYARGLCHFLNKKDESSLQKAYEVGRQAILIESSLLHVIMVHHRILADTLVSGEDLEENRQTIRSAGEFLQETLAAFEMIQRGYGDTVSTLREKTEALDDTNRRLLKLNETLETRIAEKTASAEDKAKELARANDEMEQFVHAAAHDLKEPLRTITSYVQLFQMTCLDSIKGNANEYLGYVIEGTHRLQELIDDLLSYTRLNAEPQPLKPIDLNKVLRDTISSLDTVIKETGALITAAPLPVVRSNQSHMVLLFQNLISNALKFHGKDPPRIHVSAAREDGHWLFRVSDNGIGIDEKYFGKLFVLFQRLSTRDEYPGTGIGLAICRKIVEQQNGKIWVESKVGQGSTFCFTLPDPASKDEQDQ